MKFDIKVNRILEMYLNLDSQGSLYPKDPETNKVIKSDSFPIPEDAVKVDQINSIPAILEQSLFCKSHITRVIKNIPPRDGMFFN